MSSDSEEEYAYGEVTKREHINNMINLTDCETKSTRHSHYHGKQLRWWVLYDRNGAFNQFNPDRDITKMPTSFRKHDIITIVCCKPDYPGEYHTSNHVIYQLAGWDKCIPRNHPARVWVGQNHNT